MRLNYIHHGDCLDWLKTISDNSVDIIWTDPPYGNNQNNGDLAHRWEQALGISKNTESDARPILNDDPDSWERVVKGMLSEAKRILKKDSVCCCCCCGGGGPKVLFARVADWMDEVLAFDQAVVWDKGGLGLGWKYRRNYEFVMVAHRKGGKLKWEAPFRDKRTANVVHINRIIPGKEEHPTPKPPALIEHFLTLHGKPGDVVCDPFAGAGTTLAVAKRMGMNSIGCELDPHWHKVAEERIDAVNAPLLEV